jgi:hypothetical protein
MQLLTRIHQLRAPWMAWWLALALVVAPALGRMHEVLHAPALPHTQIQAHNAAPAHAHEHITQSGDVLGSDLFGSHSALECLALDQLGHALGFNFGPLAVVHALPSSPPVWSTAHTALPVPTALFDARAPPVAAV